MKGKLEWISDLCQSLNELIGTVNERKTRMVSMICVRDLNELIGAVHERKTRMFSMICGRLLCKLF